MLSVRRLICISTATVQIWLALASAPLISAAYSPAGWVLHAKLAHPLNVPAGARLGRILESTGQIPTDAFPTLSIIVRGIIYCTAGSSATTCQLGLAGGAVMSPPITVPADSTISVYIEDTGSEQPGARLNLTGMVVIAGFGGPVTIQPGSTFTATIIPTEKPVY
jgi:hypothetical protein